MDWFTKSTKPESWSDSAAPKEPEVVTKKEIPAVLPDKTEVECEVEGCYELKETGQNHVCVKHQRSS